MEKVTTSLPLNPKHHEKMGFLTFFLLLEELAKRYEVASFPMLDTGESAQEDQKILLQKLQLLGLDSKNLHNKEIFTPEMVQEVMIELYKKGIITIAEKTIHRCHCGKIQFIEGSKLSDSKKSLLDSNGLSKCCSSSIHKTTARVLLTKPLDKITTRIVSFPDWFIKEIHWFGEKFDFPFLISRVTPQKYSAIVEGDHFYLDADHLFYFYLLFYAYMEKELTSVVAGPSTIKQLAFMLHFGQMLKLSLPKSVYSIPKINYSKETRETFTEMVKRYGPVRVRNALLWASLSNRKEININEGHIKGSNEEVIIPVVEDKN